jgi:hypothetical protein
MGWSAAAQWKEPQNSCSPERNGGVGAKKMWLRQAPSGSAGHWPALPLRGGAGGGRGRGRREEAEPARRRRRLGAVRGSGASVAEKEAGGGARRRSREGEEAAGEEAKVLANG